MDYQTALDSMLTKQTKLKALTDKYAELEKYIIALATEKLIDYDYISDIEDWNYECINVINNQIKVCFSKEIVDGWDGVVLDHDYFNVDLNDDDFNLGIDGIKKNRFEREKNKILEMKQKKIQENNEAEYKQYLELKNKYEKFSVEWLTF